MSLFSNDDGFWSEVLNNTIEGIMLPFMWLFEKIAIGFIYMIDRIPVPDFINNIVPAANQVLNFAAYPLYLCAFDIGWKIMLSALVARFLLKLIPFVG